MWSHTSRALSARLASIRTTRQALVKPGWRPLLLRSTSSSNLFAQNPVAKKIGQTGDGLLHGADAPHYFGTLLQQLAQLFVSLPHYFLHMSIPVAGGIRLEPASLPVLHKILPSRALVWTVSSLAHSPPGERYAGGPAGVPGVSSQFHPSTRLILYRRSFCG